MRLFDCSLMSGGLLIHPVHQLHDVCGINLFVAVDIGILLAEVVAFGQLTHDMLGNGLHVFSVHYAIAVGITREERDGDVGIVVDVECAWEAAIAHVAPEQCLESVGVLVNPSGAGRLVDGCVGQEVTAEGIETGVGVGLRGEAHP